MADIVSAAKRSQMMAGIRGRNTKPELAVRKYLHASGFRFRLHVQNLPGRPDIVLPRYRTIVNVHGCFWHQHPGCRYAYMPSSNKEFWQAKLGGNRKRDRRNDRELRGLGWSVITVWECEARDPRALSKVVNRIRSNL